MPIGERLADLGFAAGWTAVRRLPEPLARRGFRLAADAATRRDGKGVQRLRANLRRAAPQLDEAALDDLVRDAMRSYARYWLEVFRLPAISADRVARDTEVVREDVVHDAVAAGKGAILVLPHTGNWDAAAVWFLSTGNGFTTVAERLRPESLFDRFIAFREGLGMEVIPLTGGAAPPYELLRERLLAGGVLALLADRDLTARGVDVVLLGEATRFPAGPAALALDTGAALLPVTLSFTPKGWRLRFFEPVTHPQVGSREAKVAAMTQAVADAFSEGIAEAPADWHMLQRLFLADLAPDDPRRAAQHAEPA